MPIFSPHLSRWAAYLSLSFCVFVCLSCQKSPPTPFESFVIPGSQPPQFPNYPSSPGFRNFDTGYFSFGVGAGEDVARAAVMQSDGKLILAGRSNNGSFDDFFMARIWLDGSFDTSFDGDGRVITSYPEGASLAHAVVLDSENRILLAGRRWGVGDYDFGVSRYLSDGSVDTSFGTGGTRRIDFGGHDFGRGVAVDSIGRIYVGGYSNQSGAFDFAIARLTSQGDLDNAFAGDGTFTIGTAGTDQVHALVVDSSNRPILAGSIGGANSQFAIVRFSTAGVFEAVGLHNFAAGEDIPYAMTLDSSQNVIAGGRSHNGANFDFAMVKFSAPTYAVKPFNVTTAIGAAADGIRHLQITDTNHIVASGHSGSGADWDFAIARYNSAGVLDTSFGTAGSTTVDCTGNDDWAFGQAFRDGKKMLVGRSGGVGSYDVCVARFNVDGTLATSSDFDQNFSADGQSVNLLAGSGAEQGYSMELDALGRAVLVGTANNGVGIARYNTDGSLDTSFSGDGMHSAVINGSTGDLPYGMAFQSDGKILMAGYDNGQTFVSRFTTSGVADATFGTSGHFSQILGGVSLSYGTSVEQDSSGRIIVAGSGNNFLEDFIVSRLTAGGVVDGTFGTAGTTVQNMGGSLELALDLFIDTSDRIVVGGYVLNTDWEMGVARFLPNGSLDTSFGTGGTRVIDIGANTNDFLWRMHESPDDKIYLIGQTSNDFCVVRLNSNGTNDAGFATGGVFTTNISGGDFAYDMAIQPNGKLLVSGSSNGEMSVIRLLTNGSLDTTFDGDGKAIVNVGSGGSSAYGIAVREDGRIVLGGFANNGSGNGFAAAQIWP